MKLFLGFLPLLLLLVIGSGEGFQAFVITQQCSPLTGVSTRSLPSSRQRHIIEVRAGSGSNFFEDIRKFFDGSGGWGDNNRSNDNSNNGDDDDSDLPAGTFRVATIPVESVKPGGLRLFLMFYLMGQQNTPERGSWKANQPTMDEYVLDFWYCDQTAVLTITLTEKAITIDRTGSNPSTSYMMQETVVVQGILDELHQCAFDEAIAEEHRLLILPEPKDAIERARDALAFA